MSELRPDQVKALFTNALAEGLAEGMGGDAAMNSAIRCIYSVGHAHGYEEAAERSEQAGYPKIAKALRMMRR